MTATLTNISRNSATVANISLSQKTLSQYTIAELATRTLADLGPETFETKHLTVFTNQTKS